MSSSTESSMEAPLSSYPPPPPLAAPYPPFAPTAPAPGVATKAPAIAWLVPLAAVVGIIGGVLPWFKPVGYFGRAHGGARSIGLVAHAWQGGAVGVLGPVLLVVIGAMVLRGLLSSGPAKPGKNPVRRNGILAVLFALITVGLLGAARALIYHSTVTVTVGSVSKSIKIDDYAAAVGAHAISHGTQLGFWITTAAAAIALIGGIAMIVVGKKA